MAERLLTLASDLAPVLEQADEQMLRRAARESAQWAVKHVQLQDPVSDRGLARVASLDFGVSDERRAVENLVGELDERAWDLQDGVERGEATEEEYVAAFTRARAASAVWFALDEDPRRAAYEALYEAAAATAELPRLRDLVIRATSASG